MLDRYEQYMQDVISGKETACKWVILACKRQKSDLKRQSSPGFPYYFDTAAASKAIGFSKMLRHVSGKWAGERFNPEPDQCFLLAVLFGWKSTETHTRRFRRAYCEVARKNGKSFMASMIQLIGLLLDNESRAEIFSAATTRDQARIVFDVCKDMVNRLCADSPSIASRIKVYQHSIINTETKGKISPLSSDAQKLDGHSPHIAIVDEYHEHRDNKVLKVLETGMGARSQPLSFVITTAGFNIEGPCFQLRKTATQILDGAMTDETFFAAIYTLDEGDDFKDRKNWKKSNPHIGISPSWEFMEAEFTKAMNEGQSAEVHFLTKNLNVWTSSSSTWIQADKWAALERAVNWDDFIGRRCFGGFDFAEVYDFTALCLAFPPTDADGEYFLRWHFWYPEDRADALSTAAGVPIRQWERDGWITLTSGDMVDIEAVIEETAATFGKDYRIESVAIDPWGSKTNLLKLAEVGMEIYEVRQGFRTMSPAITDFESLLGKKKLVHDGNPVMRWMMTNVDITRDPAGNRKVDRSSKTGKVDGVIAALMALALAVANNKPSGGSYLFDEQSKLITI
jgi:phage terminase large subunit-like protein